MHWFDDFVKGLAGGSVPRRTALAGVGLASGSLAAWGALPGRALASPRVSANAGDAVRFPGGSASATAPPLKLTRGIVRRRLTLPSTFSSGPCAYKRGDALDAMTYTAAGVANGQPVTLTASRNLQFVPGVGRTALSAQSTNVIEVTSGGASVVRFESKVAGTQEGTARGTVSLRYGSAVSGARGADLTVVGRTVTGTILGAERAVASSRSKLISSKFFEGAAPLDLAIDGQLYAAIDQLMQRFKSEASTCNGTPPRRGRASRRASTRGAFLSPAIERREFVVADYAPEAPGGDAGLEIQNQYGAPSTPHCTSCMNSAGNQMVTCLEAAGVQAIFGDIGDAIIGAIECQAKATAAALACWIPKAGCGEQLCGVGTSCDSGDTCCGTDCCTGSDVCIGQSKTCCPPGYTTVCAGTPGSDPFCCGEGQACCGSDGCCAAGSTCCGGKFCCASGDQCCGDVCCNGAGSVCTDPKNSLCCNSGSTACGTSCCDAKYVCLDSTKGICAPPGYMICGNLPCPPDNCLNPGTPNAACCPGPVCGNTCCKLFTATPTPSPFPSGGIGVIKQRLRTCVIPNTVACHNEFSGTQYTACCAPNQTCCGDQCCPSSAPQCCPDGQGNPRCGICIK